MVDMRKDFQWLSSGEPHAMRRRELLAKYGSQIRQLYGYDHATARQVALVASIQLIMAYYVQNWSWGWLIVASWAISGTLNKNIFLAMHEIGHFLAFKKPFHNKLLMLLTNIPVGVPVATKFREYHHEHHTFMGVDEDDVDLPTKLEGKWVRGFFPKLAYMFCYILVYAIRPLFIRPKPVQIEDIINWAVVLGSDCCILYFWGFKSLAYLLLGSFFAGSIHPLAGHMLAEHYELEKGQETYSYYGPLNLLAYNVGLHTEHHDFPNIPQTRLHKLREIAPEYYNHLFHHSSWCWIIWEFITNPDVGPWTRTRRVERSGNPDSNQEFKASNFQYSKLAKNEDTARQITISRTRSHAAHTPAAARTAAKATRNVARRCAASENTPNN